MDGHDTGRCLLPLTDIAKCGGGGRGVVVVWREGEGMGGGWMAWARYQCVAVPTTLANKVTMF